MWGARQVRALARRGSLGDQPPDNFLSECGVRPRPLPKCPPSRDTHATFWPPTFLPCFSTEIVAVWLASGVDHALFANTSSPRPAHKISMREDSLAYHPAGARTKFESPRARGTLLAPPKAQRSIKPPAKVKSSSRRRMYLEKTRLMCTRKSVTGRCPEANPHCPRTPRTRRPTPPPPPQCHRRPRQCTSRHQALPRPATPHQVLRRLPNAIAVLLDVCLVRGASRHEWLQCSCVILMLTSHDVVALAAYTGPQDLHARLQAPRR